MQTGGVRVKWFRSLLPREDRFFELFTAHSTILVDGAVALEKLLAGDGDLAERCREIVALEHRADEITRDVLRAVRASFITPFDRGDIKDLIQSMDDAIDAMEQTVKTVSLFEQKSFEPPMHEMGLAIVEAAQLTARAIPLLKAAAANAQELSSLAEEVIRVEGRADDIHDRGLKELYHKHGRTAPMAFVIGSQIYTALERVVDRFQDVADEVSGIVIENV